MDRQRYRVVFNGRIESGKTIENVKEKIITIFKIDRTKTDQLFSGQTRIILKNSSLESCEKLQKQLWRAGAISTIQPEYTSDQPVHGGAENSKSADQSAKQVAASTEQQLQNAKSVLQEIESQEATEKNTIFKNRYAIACGGALLLIIVLVLSLIL